MNKYEEDSLTTVDVFVLFMAMFLILAGFGVMAFLFVHGMVAIVEFLL